MLDVAGWLTGSSVVSKLALSFSLQCVAFWTLCSVNSFSNCCRQRDMDPPVFVNMQSPPLAPPPENLIWIQLLVFALGLKTQWGSPSGTKVCADVRGGWVGGLWTRGRRGRLRCSPGISGYGRREWSTLGQGLGVGNQRQSKCFEKEQDSRCSSSCPYQNEDLPNSHWFSQLLIYNLWLHQASPVSWLWNVLKVKSVIKRNRVLRRYSGLFVPMVGSKSEHKGLLTVEEGATSSGFTIYFQRKNICEIKLFINLSSHATESYFSLLNDIERHWNKCKLSEYI